MKGILFISKILFIMADDTDKINREAYETCISELNIERFDDLWFTTSAFPCFDNYFKEGRELWTETCQVCSMPDCGCVIKLSIGRYIATLDRIPKCVIEYLFSHGWLTKSDRRFLELVMHSITKDSQWQNIVYLLTEFFDPEFVVNYRSDEGATVLHMLYYAYTRINEYWTSIVINFLEKYHFDFHARAGEKREQSLLRLAIGSDSHFDIYRYVHDFGLKFEETNESHYTSRFQTIETMNTCISHFLYLFHRSDGFMELYIRSKKGEPIDISDDDIRTHKVNFTRNSTRDLFNVSQTIKLCYELGYSKDMVDSTGHTLRYYVDLFSEIGHEWFGKMYDDFTSFM